MLRVVVWLFEFGVLFAIAVAAFASMCAGTRSLSGMLRAAATLVIAGALSGFAGIAVTIGSALAGSPDPMSSGLITAILSLPVSAWVLGRVGGRRESRFRAFARERRGFARGGFVRSALAPEPAADAVVASAWGRAARLAPGQRQRLASAREACSYVLHWAEAHPFDMDTMECAVLIRKRLPELVEQTASYCALAGRSEQRTVIDGMVGDIERLGRMALARVERSRSQIGESLAATRAHIASRTSETPAV